MHAATMPEICVSMASIAAIIAMTDAIPIVEVMNERLLPIFSMVYHVPREATRNHIWRIPDISKAR
jgi:hypothetical protein